jgi:hypothetical protein
MLSRKIIDVCRENHKKDKNTRRGQNADFCVTAGGFTFLPLDFESLKAL